MQGVSGRMILTVVWIAGAIVAAMGAGCSSANAPNGYIMTAKRMIEVEGRYDDAIAFLQERSQRSPKAAPVWYWLSIAYQRKGQYEQAVSAMDRAFASDSPKMSKIWYPSAYDYRGWAHYHTGNLPAALADFNRALDVADNPFIRQEVLRGRGWVRLFSGQYPEAIADFTQTFSLIEGSNRPALLDAWLGRAWSRYMSAEYSGALADLELAWRASDTDNHADRTRILWLRSWSKYYLGDFNGAIEDANLSLALNVDGRPMGLDDPRRVLGFAHLALGHDEEARNAIEKAVAEPRGLATDRDLGLIYLVQGQREKAFSFWGGAGWLGVDIMDYKEGDVSGVRIVHVFSASPAQAAGLLRGDVVLAIDQQPTRSAAELTGAVKLRRSGETVQVDILRNAARSSHAVTVASAESHMAALPLLAPVLKVRPIPPASAGTPVQTVADAPPVPQTVSAGAVEGAVAEPSAVATPTLVINAMRVEPQPVKGGEPFNVSIDLLAEDSATLEMELELTLVCAITQDGKSLLDSAPEKLTVVNGEPKTTVKKMRASRAAGDYTFQVTLTRGEQTARQSVGFRIE
ncbi:MAG TPA: PDZ domain-containing protein [Sedimentisphaerales bacterium]|nr:PDZ domain-containing protein [Sedimentisphaerales bacterium]